MAYTSYSEYQQSHQEWIGKIPSHWGYISIKRKYRIVNGATPKSSEPLFWDGNIVWVTPSDFDKIYDGYIRTSSRMITSHGLSACGTKIVPKESVIITTRAPIGKIAQAGSELCTNQGCKSLVRDSNDLHERFLFYSLIVSNSQLNALGLGSTFMELSNSDLGYYPVTLPPTEEQQKIGDFLDWKTGQIDSLIGKKQQLIEKLKEKRIALITQAVTKGLNPDAPLRDPKIAGLEKVPNGWTLNYKLGFLAASERNSFVNGPFGSDLLTSELVNEGVPVIYSGDVKATIFNRKSDKYVTEEKARTLNFCRAVPGDVLLAKVGDPPGDACVYPVENSSAIVTQDVVRIRVDREVVDPEFLSYFLVSSLGRHLVRLVTVESTRGRFSLADLKSVRFPIPKISEQIEIAKYISIELEGIDKMIALNQKAIDHLTEYRASLITATTTGKIDVRHVIIGGTS